MSDLDNFLDHSINPENGNLLIYYDEFEKEIKRLYSKLESERDEQTRFAKEWKDNYFKLLDELQALKEAGNVLVEVLNDKDSDEVNKQTQIDHFKSLIK